LLRLKKGRFQKRRYHQVVEIKKKNKKIAGKMGGDQRKGISGGKHKRETRGMRGFPPPAGELNRSVAGARNIRAQKWKGSVRLISGRRPLGGRGEATASIDQLGRTKGLFPPRSTKWWKESKKALLIKGEQTGCAANKTAFARCEGKGMSAHRKTVGERWGTPYHGYCVWERKGNVD